MKMLVKPIRIERGALTRGKFALPELVKMALRGVRTFVPVAAGVAKHAYLACRKTYERRMTQNYVDTYLDSRWNKGTFWRWFSSVHSVRVRGYNHARSGNCHRVCSHL